jgi:hypothetical protein
VFTVAGARGQNLVECSNCKADLTFDEFKRIVVVAETPEVKQEKIAAVRTQLQPLQAFVIAKLCAACVLPCAVLHAFLLPCLMLTRIVLLCGCPSVAGRGEEGCGESPFPSAARSSTAPFAQLEPLQHACSVFKSVEWPLKHGVWHSGLLQAAAKKKTKAVVAAE